MTAQEIDRIECAIRHIQTAADIDPWAVEIAVRAMEMKIKALRTDGDTISRQAAIALIENESRKCGDEYGVSDVLCDLSDMPYAQPERKKISEEKMKIVIENYFKDECDVNTSIKSAFEKGFRIGVKKGMAL